MNRVNTVRKQLPRMMEHIEALVRAESPSNDRDAVRNCARLTASIGTELLGESPDALEIGGRVHLRWEFGRRTRVLLLGHLDTVWPIGTLERWPFFIADGKASGPGVLDMKCGVISALYGTAALSDLDGVTIVLTGDEEIGSPTSRTLVEESARGADATFVLEPSAGGALKIARKGVSMYKMWIKGRAAHAGLEPERGVNSLVELAHQVLAISSLADPILGTSVTPTVAHAGTATNVVPAEAVIEVDVRVEEPAEQTRIDGEIRELKVILTEAAIEIDGGPNRPPFPLRASAALFERAQTLAGKLGLQALRGEKVGGASDGNFSAAVDCPTLDGLGAVGDGAHAEGEHIVIDAIPERTALLSALVADILGS